MPRIQPPTGLQSNACVLSLSVYGSYIHSSLYFLAPTTSISCIALLCCPWPKNAQEQKFYHVTMTIDIWWLLISAGSALTLTKPGPRVLAGTESHTYILVFLCLNSTFSIHVYHTENVSEIQSRSLSLSAKAT